MASITQLTINIYSFIILLILSLVFFRKQRMHQIEDNTYAKILITTMVTLFVGIVLGIVVSNPNSNQTLMLMLDKLYLIGLTIIITIFSFYTYNVFKKGKHLDTIKSFYTIIYIMNIIIISFLPLNIEVNASGAVPTGPSLYYTFSYLTAIYILMLLFLIIDRKNFKNPKYLPIILMIISYIAFAGVLELEPTLNYLLNPLIVAIILIMYFTIENPDVKMVEELYKNKGIIEKNNEETSNLLFKISQDIKNPVKEIIDITNNEDNRKLKEVNNLGKNLDYVIDNVLDVTKMTSKDLKIYNTKYNPKNLFNELKAKTENELKNNDVKLEFKLSENIPEYVYGDAINLKQILNTIIENSIKNTKKGFIEFEVNTIIKYGTCRFIIDINDTSNGISIDKVNEILSLKETEINDDETIENLKQAKSLMTRLGGGFMLKSEENKGTTVSITIDQKIFETGKINQKLDKYETSIIKNKRVMVVDDDAKELSEITNLLEENNIIVNSSLFGKDIIEKIKNNYKFDLIILDDETNTYSALTVLKELQKNEKFNIPVIVMINSNKETIIKHYLNDGFADVIKKGNLKEEIKRIINKI